jgi:hypothetical protein
MCNRWLRDAQAFSGRRRSAHTPHNGSKDLWDRPGTGAFVGPQVQRFVRKKCPALSREIDSASCKTVIRGFESRPHLRVKQPDPESDQHYGDRPRGGGFPIVSQNKSKKSARTLRKRGSSWCVNGRGSVCPLETRTLDAAAHRREDFIIDESGSDAARTRFMTEHADQATGILAAEVKRRERRATRADDQTELFDDGTSNDAEEDADD